MTPQNIFITGSSGKVGRFLIAALLSEGHHLSLLGRDGSKLFDDDRVKHVSGDLLKPDSYAPGLAGSDVVVHLGGLTHTNEVSKYYKVNSEATLQLLGLCETYAVKRFIFISTRAISERGGDYSRSKAMAEKYVQQSALRWVILRLAEVYGTSGGEGMDMLLNNISAFPIVPIVGDGQYTLAPIHISDVVSAIKKIIDRTDISNRLYNIAGPESFTYNDLIDRILLARRLKRFKVHIPLNLARRFLQMSALILKDNSLAVDQLPRLISGKSDDISLAVKDFSFNPAKLANMMVADGKF